jgi:hypothetical protein
MNENNISENEKVTSGFYNPKTITMGDIKLKAKEHGVDPKAVAFMIWLVSLGQSDIDKLVELMTRD